MAKPMKVADKMAARDVALEALANGKTPTEAATEAGVDLATVREWMKRDAPFRAELNSRRRDSYNAGADRLRALVPAALEVLEAEIAGGNVHAALAVLKAAGLGRLEAPSGPTDARAIESSDRQHELLLRLGG
jgi:hypothetical protein